MKRLVVIALCMVALVWLFSAVEGRTRCERKCKYHCRPRQHNRFFPALRCYRRCWKLGRTCDDCWGWGWGRFCIKCVNGYQLDTTGQQCIPTIIPLQPTPEAPTSKLPDAATTTQAAAETTTEPPSVTTRTDPCSSTPCQNSGACTSSGDGYSCQCTTGYTGTNCDQARVANCELDVVTFRYDLSLFVGSCSTAESQITHGSVKFDNHTNQPNTYHVNICYDFLHTSDADDGVHLFEVDPFQCTMAKDPEIYKIYSVVDSWTALLDRLKNAPSGTLFLLMTIQFTTTGRTAPTAAITELATLCKIDITAAAVDGNFVIVCEVGYSAKSIGYVNPSSTGSIWFFAGVTGTPGSGMNLADVAT